MKVLLLNGSPHEKGCTYTALMEMAGQFQKRGVETELFWIGNGPVRGCIDCKSCWGKGRCVFDDDCVNRLIEKIAACDGLVIGTPVYFGGIPGGLKCVLHRVFYDAKRLFSGKPAAGVVSCRRGGAGSTFDQLNKYFTISSMPVVASQYWNSVHGRVPGEVLQDAEGMQTMRTLGRNMAWLLKCIEAGRAVGIQRPVAEPSLVTNFIR